MKSSQSTSRKLNLLIDTSFLLPAMGIEVENEVLEAIKYFHLVNVHFMEVSVLEAMWKILKIIPREKLNLVYRGLSAIKETYTLVSAPPNAYVKAYEMLHRGHRDYVDNLLYATAHEEKMFFLTNDQDFIDFLTSTGYPTESVLTPLKLQKLLRQAT